MVVREAALSDEDQLVSNLAELGLGRNEARLYLAAVGRPPLRVAELAELAHINRPKAYDALRDAAFKGLFVQEPGRIARFRAADPWLVVQRLRQRSIREQADLVADTSRLVADLFERYYAVGESDNPFDSVELIRNCEAAWARREAITAGAREEVLLARRLSPGGVGPADVYGPRGGVACRSLYERGCLFDPDFRRRIADREERGEGIRFVDRVRVGICVVDRSVLMLSLNPVGVISGPGTWLVLAHPGIAAMLAGVFDRDWAAADAAAAR